MKKGKFIAVRPNSIIEARYDLTSKENDILDMVLSKIKDDNIFSYELCLEEYATIYTKGATNIYRDFKKATKEMEGKGFRIIDIEKNREIFFVWFSAIQYLENEGKIYIEIGQQLKRLLLNMKKKIFYKIEYPLNFTNIYSKRIYYYLISFKDTGWRIDKLEDLKNKLNCPESYNKYGLFRTNVLDKAQEEINKNSDIKFDYEEIKKGKKVTSIKFRIYQKEKPNAKEEAKALEEVSATIEPSKEIEEVKSIIREKISDRDAENILRSADGDIQIIKEKYAMTKNKSSINNLVGWMIKSIKEDFQEPIRKNNNTFHDYEQRIYDFEDLEKKSRERLINSKKA